MVLLRVLPGAGFIVMANVLKGLRRHLSVSLES